MGGITQNRVTAGFRISALNDDFDDGDSVRGFFFWYSDFLPPLFPFHITFNVISDKTMIVKPDLEHFLSAIVKVPAIITSVGKF